MVLFQVLISEIVKVMSPAGLNRNSGTPEHDGHKVSLKAAFIFISNGGDPSTGSLIAQRSTPATAMARHPQDRQWSSAC